MYKVILVDDEPIIIHSLQKILEKNTEFSVVASAFMVSEAKLLIEKHRPDVVFTDIKMPGGNGLELVRHVLAHQPNCLMVVISGYDDFSFVRKAFIYGVFDYLLKPVSGSAFAKVLENLRKRLQNLPVNASELEIQTPIDPTEKLVHAIEDYLHHHISEDNSIQSICKIFSISQPYLSRIFRETRDCTYNEFLLYIKIAHAKKLLLENPDMLLATVARLTGFSDQFYFSKVFKSAVGTTPSEFRRRD